MHVLIVESRSELGWIWKRHLERQGCEVSLVGSQNEAIDVIRDEAVQVIILDIVLQDGSALAVADFASYRRPDAKVIFVTDTTFFSDGSIFQIAPNACAFLRTETRPEDLAAMVEYHGAATL